MIRPAARLAVILVAALGPGVGLATDGDFAGRYVGAEDPSLMLTVDAPSEGRVTGRLTDGYTDMALEARLQGGGFAGTFRRDGAILPVSARIEGGQLRLEVGPAGESEGITFVRSGGAPAGGEPADAAVPGNGAVVINGTTLSAADLARVQGAYRIRIPPGDYWYDRVLGAWGGRGGPTMGFISPGLELGGRLRADASGSGTSVVVNGRALHPYDLLALQQITGPIAPGRYFITADGLAGLEGGPPLWNLAALAAQSRASGGGSTTWQSRITGASGFSDGTTGAVFLPNGGIVSTGN